MSSRLLHAKLDPTRTLLQGFWFRNPARRSSPVRKPNGMLMEAGRTPGAGVPRQGAGALMPCSCV